MVITPSIQIATALLIELIRLARNAKEMNAMEFEEIKKMIDEEFAHFPDWDEL